MKITLTNEFAKVPTRGTEHAAGYDLYSPVDIFIGRGCTVPINLHIKLELSLDHNVYAQIHDRSSMAKKGVFTVAGVIDRDYRGEITILLHNTGPTYTVSKGDRVAQMIFHEYATPTFEVAESVSNTLRGEGGFGSTGV